MFNRHKTTTYMMREKLVAIGDDYWIENSDGDRVYKVNGKALRVRDTLSFEDANGHELLKIQQKLMHIKKTMEIEDNDGNVVASVHKALITPLRDRWIVDLKDGGELKIKGNLLEHEYKMEKDGDKVAEASKKWFRVRDTYGVEIQDGQNDALLLAITAVLDQMTHDLV